MEDPMGAPDTEDVEAEPVLPEGLGRKLRGFREALLSWYFGERREKYPWRDFPWRSDEAGKYEKLVAEILLQKTRAENVLEVYRNLLERYPTFEDLARARYEDLAELLKPVGLYRNRARSLVKLARRVVELGGVPSSPEELEKLPGVGPYIANIFLVLALNKRLPVVDTNIRRVCERVFSVKAKRDPRRDPEIWRFVEALLPRENFKEFILALLDFSAVICRKKNPRCAECPVAGLCDHLASASSA